MTGWEPKHLPLEGLQVIEASAGTGKTHTLTELYLRLLLERGLLVEQILVVTFTNAATFELRARLRARLQRAWQEARTAIGGAGHGEPSTQAEAERAARLQVALGELDRAQVFTIHGFCQRVLKEHAFESGARFGLELVTDLSPLLREVAEDFFVQHLHRALPEQVGELGGTEALVRLLKLLTAQPLLELWRDEPPVPADQVERALLAFESAFLELKRAWQGAEGEVLAWVERTRQKGTSHRKGHVTNWVGKLSRYCRECDDGKSAESNWFEQLEKLTFSTLAGALEQPPAIPEVFRLVEALAERRAERDGILEAWCRGLLCELFKRAPQELGKRKAEMQILSFDDQLLGLRAGLRGAMGHHLAARIRQAYPAILVDEFQDTDPIQYEIFQRIHQAGPGLLALVGDPKQAIYAFRGADIHSYLRAAAEAGEHRHTLSVNYRSDPGLLSVQNAAFGSLTEPFLLPGLSYLPVTARPGAKDALEQAGQVAAPWELFWLSKEESAQDESVAALVAAEVARKLDGTLRLSGRVVEPADIAVLTRSNVQARAVQDELRKLRIPSVLRGDTSVLDTNEADELRFLLHALVAPSEAAAVRVALTTAIFGKSAAELLELDTDEGAWDSLVESFHRYHERWQRSGFLPAFRQLFEEQDAYLRLASLVDGERRLTNLLHLAELLHEQAAERHLGMHGVLKWLEQMQSRDKESGGLAPELLQLRLESDERAVQLTTVHKSKGLEYPIVFCPFARKGRLFFGGEEEQLVFHDRDDGMQVKLALLSPKGGVAHGWAEEERRQENLRLLYVAATRARHQLVWFAGSGGDYEDSALAWLLHGPRDGSTTTPKELAARLKPPIPSKGVAKAEAHAAGLSLELRSLEERFNGGLVVKRCTDEPAPRYRGGSEVKAQLLARKSARVFDSTWRSSSFSELTRSERAFGGLEPEPGRDWDGGDVELVAEHFIGKDTVTLDAFPRGAQAGTLLHTALERLEFSELGDESKVLAVTLPLLATAGLSAQSFAAPLSRALGEIAKTALDTGAARSTQAPLRLLDVASAKRTSELEFTLPVSRGAEALLSPERLASAFQPFSGKQGGVPATYVARLRELRFLPLTGFLRGYIDLMFEHDGRYYVADYKSNHLGSQYRDYERPSLERAMVDHHYILQYHLYVLAVHRLLRQRVKGYDYEQSFGGVYYLFLRGMREASGPRSGVYFDRPPFALIQALDRLVGGTPQGALAGQAAVSP